MFSVLLLYYYFFLFFAVPAAKLAGDTLPPSCLYLCRVLGAPMALLFLLHFFTCQWWDFLPPSTNTSKPHIFFKNFLSTYLALIQASFSCLREGKRKPFLFRNPQYKYCSEALFTWREFAYRPRAVGSGFFQTSFFTGTFVDVINYSVSKFTH